MAHDPAHPHPSHHGLNPALDGAKFCPHCGASGLVVDFPRSLRCESCRHIAFYNPKPVAATIPRTASGEIVLLRRGFEPGAGRWTFPGGFVDLGETVEEAARREAMEELEIGIELTGLVGVYSRPQDRVVLVVYEGTTTDVPQTTPEATEVRAFAPEAIPWDELAFWSTAAALRDALGRSGGGEGIDVGREHLGADAPARTDTGSPAS